MRTKEEILNNPFRSAMDNSALAIELLFDIRDLLMEQRTPLPAPPVTQERFSQIIRGAEGAEDVIGSLYPNKTRIQDTRMWCPECDWNGAASEAVPDVDGDGSLGCPRCENVLELWADRGALI